MVKRERTHYVKQTKEETGKIEAVKVSDTVPFKCPKCQHRKAWKHRGEIPTLYRFKCCRCGHMEPLKRGACLNTPHCED